MFLTADEFERGVLIRAAPGSRDDNDEYVPGGETRTDIAFASYPSGSGGGGGGGTSETPGQAGDRVRADRIFVLRSSARTTRIGENEAGPDVIERERDGLRYRVVRAKDWGRLTQVFAVREDDQGDG